MKEIDDIINEQALLLKWNGYAEKQLNNGEPEGSYRENLRMAVQEIREADKILFDREPFQVHLFGYFNQNQDKVLFTFSYEYDAFPAKIELKEVQASLNNIPINIAIQKGGDLWSSKELYSRVKELSSVINTALANDLDTEIKEIIQREIKILNNNGYTNSNLERQLTNTINKIESTTSKDARDFIIASKMKLGDNSEIMHYKLHYNYHPASADLNLKSVYGRIGPVSKVFMNTTSYPAPSADSLYTFLLHENRTSKAQSIVKQGNSPEILKKKLK